MNDQCGILLFQKLKISIFTPFFIILAISKAYTQRFIFKYSLDSIPVQLHLEPHMFTKNRLITVGMALVVFAAINKVRALRPVKNLIN